MKYLISLKLYFINLRFKNKQNNLKSYSQSEILQLTKFVNK